MTHRTDLYIAGQPAPAIAADRRDTGTGCARRWPRAAGSFLANCLFICCLATFWQAAEAATVHSPSRPGAHPAIIPAAVTMDASTASIVGTADLSGEPTGNPQPPLRAWQHRHLPPPGLMNWASPRGGSWNPALTSANFN
ncbi:hypothetical protein [Desulfovibrio sp. G11]|uniref:hypothetical protein n=1 Tax=Desulfovibrio sp. G11 TaxID=631220 RepID=UPI001E47B8D7|nr:hypothetical protein [Desulfovibrio sp. G11]